MKTHIRLFDEVPAAGPDTGGGSDLYGSVAPAPTPVVAPAPVTPVATPATPAPAVSAAPATPASAPTTPVAAAPAVPQTVKLDAETMAELKRATGGQITKQEAQQLTPQQINEILNPVVVDIKRMQALGFTDPTPEQIAAFQALHNDTVKNAVSVARLIIEQERSQFNDRLNPMLAHYQQQQAHETQKAFFTQFPALEKYPKLVQLAAREIQSEPGSGNMSPEQVIQAVAKRATDTMASLGIVPTSTPASPVAPTVGDPVPKPAALSGGGQSGGLGQPGKKNESETDIYG